MTLCRRGRSDFANGLRTGLEMTSTTIKQPPLTPAVPTTTQIRWTSTARQCDRMRCRTPLRVGPGRPKDVNAYDVVPPRPGAQSVDVFHAKSVMNHVDRATGWTFQCGQRVRGGTTLAGGRRIGSKPRTRGDPDRSNASVYAAETARSRPKSQAMYPSLTLSCVSSPQRRASGTSAHPPGLPDSLLAPTGRRRARRSVDAAPGARTRRPCHPAALPAPRASRHARERPDP